MGRIERQTVGELAAGVDVPRVGGGRHEAGGRAQLHQCRHPRVQAAGTEHPVHASLMRYVHSVLGSETGWRIKPQGEAIGPVEAHRRGLILTRSVQRVGVWR